MRGPRLLHREDPVIDQPAFETTRFGRAPLLFTVEHASRSLPAPLELTERDRPWIETHWGWDLGAEPLTRAVCDHLGATAHFARFSRLLVDANRPEEAPDLIRSRVGGHLLGFNEGVDDDERERRLAGFYRPYHRAIDETLHDMGTPALFAVHTFTPVLHEEVREMEIGVLFDDHATLAYELFELLADAGFLVALNAPYSGKDGLMYSPWRHGRAHGVPYLELEIRQDLVSTPARVTALGERLGRLLRRFDPIASRL